MKENYTEILSGFAADLKFEDIPEEVIRRAKHLTLHTLGASIASLPLEQAQNAIRYAGQDGGREEATIWGSNGKKVPAGDAAFANGTMADILDWEDCAWTGHPAAGTIPASLAVGEALQRSGKEYIEAVVAAYEVYTRVSMSAQPTREAILGKKMMWGLVSWQIFASSVAAAKLMQLDVKKIEQSFGAAYYLSIAPGTKHNFGPATSDIYHFAHGFSARNGVTAAQIADIGFDNCYDGLDGWNGYWKTVSDHVDWDWIDKDLGSKYLIHETLLKHWPANVWNQGPMDCMAEIVRDHAFDVDDIVKIRISPNVGSKMTGYHTTTRTILDAQFSIPYCVCVYLLDRDPKNWFTEEMRNNEELIRLSEKVEGDGPAVATRELFEIFQSGSFPEVTIRIELKDGSVLSNSLRFPKGHPRNPYTLEEEIEHFREVGREAFSEARIREIVDAVVRLEELSDVGSLARLLAKEEKK